MIGESATYRLTTCPPAEYPQIRTVFRAGKRHLSFSFSKMRSSASYEEKSLATGESPPPCHVPLFQYTTFFISSSVIETTSFFLSDGS